MAHEDAERLERGEDLALRAGQGHGLEGPRVVDVQRGEVGAPDRVARRVDEVAAPRRRARVRRDGVGAGALRELVHAVVEGVVEARAHGDGLDAHGRARPRRRADAALAVGPVGAPGRGRRVVPAAEAPARVPGALGRVPVAEAPAGAVEPGDVPGVAEHAETGAAGRVGAVVVDLEVVRLAEFPAVGERVAQQDAVVEGAGAVVVHAVAHALADRDGLVARRQCAARGGGARGRVVPVRLVVGAKVAHERRDDLRADGAHAGVEHEVRAPELGEGRRDVRLAAAAVLPVVRAVLQVPLRLGDAAVAEHGAGPARVVPGVELPVRRRGGRRPRGRVDVGEVGRGRRRVGGRAARAGHARLGARRIRQALGEERGSRVGRRRSRVGQCLLLGAHGDHEEQPAGRHRYERAHCTLEY